MTRTVPVRQMSKVIGTIIAAGFDAAIIAGLISVWLIIVRAAFGKKPR